MRKGTLARLEIFVGIIAIAAMFVLAGYALVSTLSDRLDPKVRHCVERNMHGTFDEKPMTRDVARALCKRLQVEGALDEQR